MKPGRLKQAEKEGRQTACATMLQLLMNGIRKRKEGKKQTMRLQWHSRKLFILWERGQDARRPQRPRWNKLKYGPLILLRDGSCGTSVHTRACTHAVPLE